MKQRILFAEDEPISRKLISRYLRGEGYDVDEAKDGAEALDFLNSFQFDLVISDIRMPRVDGIELITRLGSIYPDTPFIVLTSLPNDALDLIDKLLLVVNSRQPVFAGKLDDPLSCGQ